MSLTPEKKWEIEVEIAKFLRNLPPEDKAQRDTIDVIDIKKFDLSMQSRSTQFSMR